MNERDIASADSLAERAVRGTAVAAAAPSDLEGLLTVEDLASFWGIPKKTVYELNSKGVGPRRIRVGRHVRYRRRDVEAWLDAQYVPVGPDAA